MSCDGIRHSNVVVTRRRPPSREVGRWTTNVFEPISAEHRLCLGLIALEQSPSHNWPSNIVCESERSIRILDVHLLIYVVSLQHCPFVNASLISSIFYSVYSNFVCVWRVHVCVKLWSIFVFWLHSNECYKWYIVAKESDRKLVEWTKTKWENKEVGKLWYTLLVSL